MKNREDKDTVPATTSGPKPAGYPLGSLESRAAARAMLNVRAQEVQAPTIYRAPHFENGSRPEPTEIHDYETGLPVAGATKTGTDPASITALGAGESADGTPEIVVTIFE